MLHGASGSGYVGYVAANARLGIPALKINDGPQGFRDDSHPGSTTCWPSALTMGATWDRDLCYQWGVLKNDSVYCYQVSYINTSNTVGSNRSRILWER